MIWNEHEGRINVVDGFCFRCMMPTVQNGVCRRCGEKETGYYDGNSLKPGSSLEEGRFMVGRKIGSGDSGIT